MSEFTTLHNIQMPDHFHEQSLNCVLSQGLYQLDSSPLTPTAFPRLLKCQKSGICLKMVHTAPMSWISLAAGPLVRQSSDQLQELQNSKQIVRTQGLVLIHSKNSISLKWTPGKLL